MAEAVGVVAGFYAIVQLSLEISRYVIDFLPTQYSSLNLLLSLDVYYILLNIISKITGIASHRLPVISATIPPI